MDVPETDVTSKRQVGKGPYHICQNRRAGGVNPVLNLPDLGWSFLHVIPAMGNKFALPNVMGPQSQPRVLTGVQTGTLRFNFDQQ